MTFLTVTSDFTCVVPGGMGDGSQTNSVMAILSSAGAT